VVNRRIARCATGHRPRRGGAGDLRPGADSFRDIINVFFSITTDDADRQGGGRGTQYRSAIFYHNPEQKAARKK